MPSDKKLIYVAVRHSAFGYRRDMRFERGLEVRTISEEEFARRFEGTGAATFATYKEAYDFCFREMYGTMEPLHDERIPQAKGMFMRAMVDGLQVYNPNP